MQNQANDTTKLVVVIDDDPLVLEATAGLLNSWGCETITATSYAGVLLKLTGTGRRPDLIICDYRLSEGSNGIDVIRDLRSVYKIPALLISGDPVATTDQASDGFCLLQKPLNVATLRAALVDALVL